MEELLKIAVENGLGVCSFVALLFFIFKYVNNLNTTMEKISTTLTQVQINMATMTDRIDKIEDIISKEK